MQTSTPIIDLHVHSTLKPYGNSFYDHNPPDIFTNSSCIWFYDYCSRTDAVFENLLGISRYRQSDFTSLTDGQVKIACVSIYPVEKQFFHLRNQDYSFLEDFVGEFASMLGKARIRHIKSPGYNYFRDLQEEYLYLRLLDSIDINARNYKLIPDSTAIDTKANLLIIPSIEGCHAFCEGNETQVEDNWSNVAENIRLVKEWPSPPLFVTFAHHFYNGLCTHARSFFGTNSKLLDQEFGMRDHNFKPKDDCKPISDIGNKVINLLLSKENGRRILIDVKHMSREARIKYYEILEAHDEKIPIVWSHGAVALDEKLEINLDLDLDVRNIYKTGGIIGLEIDQRILGYNYCRIINGIKGFFFPKKKAYYEAAYVWRQIIAIAEFAYAEGFKDNPWKCIALGTDYDGVINPLNSYRDALSLSILYQNLISYLDDYWKKKNPAIPKPSQVADTDSADVIYMIMYKNAYNFILDHYI